MGKDQLQERSGSDSPGIVDRILVLHQVTETERAFYAEAQALRDARVRFAQAFQIAKSKGGSDELAKQRAIEMTMAELTLHEATYKIAEVRLVNESEGSSADEGWELPNATSFGLTD